MKAIDERTRLQLFVHYGVAGNARQFQRVRLLVAVLAEVLRVAREKSRAAFSFLPDAAAARLLRAAEDGFLDRYAGYLEKHDIGVCCHGDADYPAVLREIHDAPPLLFYRGRLQAEPRLPIAMVGSRVCTQYGRDIAQLFAHDLAAAGCTIVSGLAEGIDGCAARGALSCEESPYPTVAVLGCGIDVVYPASHGKLSEEIAERGAVVTEFLPGTRPLRENFPVRNRIISGMARGLVVVEAGERSGTSITAGYALDQGREVFAVPGRITDRQSVGTNRMIQRGEAKPVFCVDDILQEFQLEPAYDTFVSGPRRVPLSTLTQPERAVCAALSQGERSFDELADALSLPVGELNSLLTGLQFSNIIKPLSGRLYALDAISTQLVDE